MNFGWGSCKIEIEGTPLKVAPIASSRRDEQLHLARSLDLPLRAPNREIEISQVNVTQSDAMRLLAYRVIGYTGNLRLPQRPTGVLLV